MEENVEEWSDYSNVSDWEVFINEIEQALIGWGLSEGTVPFTTPSHHGGPYATKIIPYGDSNFKLSLFTDADPEHPAGKLGSVIHTWNHMNSSHSDFVDFEHRIQFWFGVRDYLVLSKLVQRSDFLSDTPKTLGVQLLSSLRLAMQGCGCFLPAFVPVTHAGSFCYVGCMATPSALLKMETAVYSNHNVRASGTCRLQFHTA